MRKRYRIGLFLFIILGLSPVSLAQDFPSRPDPPRLVNDFTGFLKPDESSRLEQKLEQFARETSTQIAIVVVKSLNGYDKSDYAFRLAEDWGIGQKGKNNGILILVKPKTGNEKGEIFIATGYGLEGAVPDAVAKRIVEVDILPAFRNGAYYEGLDKATTTLIQLTRGEYTADEYLKKTGGANTGGSVAGVLIFFILLFIFFGNFRRARHAGVGHNLPFWAALFLASSASRSNRGYFNNFSSGGGSFGGFGGFGGGSFGGGGAGGSW
ncbi:MAG: TPM domain-containing protein [Chlorobi bacterium]|nr:TPM domain-containing protein [Chlorobiota bacterium]